MEIDTLIMHLPISNVVLWGADFLFSVTLT